MNFDNFKDLIKTDDTKQMIEMIDIDKILKTLPLAFMHCD